MAASVWGMRITVGTLYGEHHGPETVQGNKAEVVLLRGATVQHIRNVMSYYVIMILHLYTCIYIYIYIYVHIYCIHTYIHIYMYIYIYIYIIYSAYIYIYITYMYIQYNITYIIYSYMYIYIYILHTCNLMPVYTNAKTDGVNHFVLRCCPVAPMPWDRHGCNAWPDKFTSRIQNQGKPTHYNTFWHEVVQTFPDMSRANILKS